MTTSVKSLFRRSLPGPTPAQSRQSLDVHPHAAISTIFAVSAKDRVCGPAARFPIPAALVAGLVAFGLLTAVASAASAQDRPTLSGTWAASAITERWNIGDWGEACGPRPAPHGAGGGTVTVTQTGGELAFSGGGYPRTTGCFEMGGGINVVSHGGGLRGWRTSCATSPNDPRRATIVTTLSATDSLISFDETGSYQFVLKEQNCTASVRRSRTYSLVKRLGEDTPPAVTASAAPAPTATATETAPVASAVRVVPPAPTDEPKPARSCDEPGEPARLEVRPSEKLLKPGESFAFRSTIADASGCRVALAPTWSVVGDVKGVTVANGTVTVDASAAEGPVVIQAAVGGKSVRANVEIVSPDRFQEILSARSLNAAGENDSAAVATLATGTVGGGAAEATDSSKVRRFAFLGVVGLSVFSLGAVGLFLFRKSKGRVVQVEEVVQGETQMRVVKKKRMVAVTVTGRKCPRCGRTFPPTTTNCPHDGTTLEAVTADPNAPPAASATAAAHTGTSNRKMCPNCGRLYAGTERFCGVEGATLVDAGPGAG
jgi:ribosomal protein S27AE